MSRPDRAPRSRAERPWALRFVRNVLLWLVPAFLVWALFTAFYSQKAAG